MKYSIILCIFVILAFAAAADLEGAAAESSVAAKSPEKRGIYGFGYGLGGYGGGIYGGNSGYYGDRSFGYPSYGYAAVHNAVPYVGHGHGYYPYHGLGYYH